MHHFFSQDITKDPLFLTVNLADSSVLLEREHKQTSSKYRLSFLFSSNTISKYVFSLYISRLFWSRRIDFIYKSIISLFSQNIETFFRIIATERFYFVMIINKRKIVNL